MYSMFQYSNDLLEFQFTVGTLSTVFGRNVLKNAEEELKPEPGPVLTLYLNMKEMSVRGWPVKIRPAIHIPVQVKHFNVTLTALMLHLLIIKLYTNPK